MHLLHTASSSSHSFSESFESSMSVAFFSVSSISVCCFVFFCKSRFDFFDRFLLFIVVVWVIWVCINKVWRLCCFFELRLYFLHHRLLCQFFFMSYHVSYQKIMVIILWVRSFVSLCFCLFSLALPMYSIRLSGFS